MFTSEEITLMVSSLASPLIDNIDSNANSFTEGSIDKHFFLYFQWAQSVQLTSCEQSKSFIEENNLFQR